VNATTHPLVERYLRDLREALRDMPRRQRDELVAEIASHIEETLPPGASDAEVLTALDRMGDPDQIAGAERERLGIDEPSAGWLEWLAILLLLIGGVVIPVVGWVVGAVFLWLSRCWSVKDKILATVLVPGGLALPFFLSVSATTVQSQTCVTGNGTDSNGHQFVTDNCSGGSLTWVQVGWIVVLALLVVVPIYTAVRLGRRLPPAGRAKIRARLPGRQAVALFIAGIAIGGAAVWYYVSTRPPGYTARAEILSGTVRFTTPDGSQIAFVRDGGADSLGVINGDGASLDTAGATIEDCTSGACTQLYGSTCLIPGRHRQHVLLGVIEAKLPNGDGRPALVWIHCE
jgi:uncharacterized membrane protein